MVKETRGRKPKSRRQHILAGTLRKHRHGEEENPYAHSLSQKPPRASKTKCGSPKRWRRSAADDRAISNGCYFDEVQAAYVVGWFRRYLCHSKGEWAGKPFDPLQWQIDEILYPLFGWMAKDGRRRYRRTYIEIAKKNGKSTLAAGVGLYMLCGDDEAGSHVFSAATDAAQAGIVHGEAIAMVESSEILSGFMDINRTTKAIWQGDYGLTYRALAYTPRSVEGLNAHCVICDELHVWRGRDLWDALKYSGRSRREPIQFVITTAGDDTESVCYEQNQRAKQVLGGQITDERLLPYIAAADVDDNFGLVRVWKKANPSLGKTLRKDDLRADYEEAQNSPRAMASFKRYSLNIWHTGVNAWLDMDAWERARRPYAAADCEGLPCWAGLDLARKNDLTALSLVFQADDGFRLLPFFWLPEQRAADLDGLVNFKDWEAAGLITFTPGDVADFAQIEADVVEILEQFRPYSLAFDEYFAEEFTQRVENETGVERIAFKQTILNFAGPTASFERMVQSGELTHNGHALLSWQAGNTEVKVDANQNMRPVKPALGGHKSIDGIVAAIMALAESAKGELEPIWSDEPVGSI